MRQLGSRGGIRATTIMGCLLVATVGCGKKDFDRTPRRPPQLIQPTGVITPANVEIQPDDFGAGPIRLIISNQTERAHTVTLEGGAFDRPIEERVGPVLPGDTAEIKKSLSPGRYTLSAGSDEAVADPIAPARFSVTRNRPTSEDQTQVP